jgi:DNA polymerase-3 subunit gamma/tau
MVLRGLEDAARAPSASAAAEMVIIRLAHVSNLPAPDEVIRVIGGVASTGGPARTDAPSPAPYPRQEKSATTTAPDAAGGEAARAPDEPPEALPFAPSENPRGSEDDDDPGEGLDEPGERPRAASGPIVLDTFDDVLALVGRHREARLKVHLEENARLVRFEPAGSIELHLLPHAPKEIANELREKLNSWTGRRWMVALSRETGARPVAEVRREREAAERRSLEGHPAVRAVLDALPEARITEVRPLKRDADDDAATG